MTSHKAIGLTTVILAAAALNAYADADEAHMNRRPIFVQGPILHNGYDGASDDLLTGGLGKTGLQALAPPDFADPLNPTAAELRVRTIYNNYRALLDMTVSGGYGVLHGPNIDVNGNPTLGEGKIAGDEYLAYADQGGGKKNVTMMVQVPASFDPNNPCIVAGPSSGSRGVYGAIASAGDWGLKHGCAVAYTDKGTGTGFHDLQANTVNLINGLRADADAAGKNSNFTAKLSVAELAAFDSATPNRFAVKHAHSQQNPEKDWGQNVLQSIEFAFYVLNQQFADRDGHHRHRPITKKNTIVIASSLSNGGNASLAAAEQDTEGLIDGVAVGEPAVQLPPTPALTIKRGTSVVTGGNKGLLDFVTLANLYQPCAALAPGNAASPGRAILINAAWATNRCALLKAKGLLTSATLVDQANESQAVLNANGWESESNLLQASHFALASQPLGVNYANAYGRFHVTDNLCGFSYGATSPTTGTPVAIAPVVAQQLFASSTGVVPTGGVNLINNNAVGGPILDAISVSPGSGVQDYNLDGALCLRSLTTGGRSRDRDEADRRVPGRFPAGAARHRGSSPQRRPARQAGHHRARPFRRAGAGQPLFAAVLRRQQVGGRQREPALLYRGHQRTALRRLHRQPAPGRLRHPVRAHPSLLAAGNGPHVQPP